MSAKKNKKDEKKKGGDSTIAVNRRARFDYEISESFEAGLVLTGTEVKSARAGNVQIAESFARLEDGPRGASEAWIHGMHIAPYEQGNVFNAEPRRRRKLLLHRHQIARLKAQIGQKGFTLVPLKMYFTRGRAKIELGLAKGRKTVDKRHTIAAREDKRAMRGGD